MRIERRSRWSGMVVGGLAAGTLVAGAAGPVQAAPPDAAPATQASAHDTPHRQYGPWVAARLGGGGYWLDTRPSAVPGRWYVWSDVGGIYRSDDDARTWRALHQHFPDDAGDVTNTRGMVELPGRPDRLVALTGTRWRPTGGIWTSDDAGQTWTKRHTGRFWGNAKGREFARTLQPDRADPDTLVAAGQDGVYRSTDGGATWSASPGAEGLNPVALVQDPADPTRWLLSSVPLSDWSLAGKFDAPGGLLESTDGGRSWQPLSNQHPMELVTDPADPARWIGSFELEVRQSRDGGRTWTPLMDGLPGPDGAPWEVNPRHFPALAVTADAVLAANGQGEVYRLAAGDQRWTPVRRQRVAAPRWWFGHYGPDDRRRPDAGEEWVHFGKSASSLTVDPRDDRRWLMTDWYALWETRDAGRSWRFAGDGLENTVLHGVAAHPTDPHRIVVFMGDNGLLSSRDGGATLHKVRFPDLRLYSNVKQVVFAPGRPEVVWAIGNTRPGQWESSTVARSTDGGASWGYAEHTGLPAGMGDERFISAIAVAPHDPARAWVSVSGPVGDHGGVYGTTDAGRTWRPVNQGLPAGADLFSKNIWDAGPELVAGADGTLLAVSKQNKHGYRLATAASSFDDLGPLPGTPAALAADPHSASTFWLATQDAGLFRSTDAGATWTAVLDKAVASVAVDPAQPGTVVVGAADGVYASADHGRTWNNLASDMPHRYFPTVAVGHGRVTAGTKGNGVFTRAWPGAADASAP